jgi:hypothetical protein
MSCCRGGGAMRWNVFIVLPWPESSSDEAMDNIAEESDRLMTFFQQPADLRNYHEVLEKEER